MVRKRNKSQGSEAAEAPRARSGSQHAAQRASPRPAKRVSKKSAGNAEAKPQRVVVVAPKPPRRRLFCVGCVVGAVLAVVAFRVFEGSGGVTDQYVMIFRDNRLSKVFDDVRNHPAFDAFDGAFNVTLPGQMAAQLSEMLDFLPEDSMSNRPGLARKAEGFSVKHPVVMIPGIVTTGLELWEGEECAREYFRMRMWGTFNMLTQFFTNKECWLRHVVLSEDDGLDPPGVKLRAATGFEAADYVIGGYWVWAKLIENLADIGYDHNHMALLGYDWRLSYARLEKRDRYFTKLQRQIEALCADVGEKVVVVVHSMGINVWLYFQNWVSVNHPNWVNNHVHTLVNVGGPVLGTPSALGRLVSGDVKDIRDLGVLGSMMDKYFPLPQRRRVFRSWGGVYGLLPVGGSAVWGDGASRAPDGATALAHLQEDGRPQRALSAEEAMDWLFVETGDDTTALYKPDYSFGIGVPRRHDSSYWNNVLQSPLPHAPYMRIVCLYGVGKDSERGMHWALSNNRSVIVPNVEVNDEDNNTIDGAIVADGDGSVPLVSLGLMCVDGWKQPELNPSGTKVITRELKHDPAPFDPRGGPNTADHVDIMGAREVLDLVLQVASGREETVEDRIISDVLAIAKRVNLAAHLKRPE